MNINKIIRKSLFGLSNRREYVCLENHAFSHPLKVYLTGSNNFSIDVTDSHLFLGYKPVIIGIPVKTNSVEASWLETNIDCCLSLCFGDDISYSKWKGLKSIKHSVARLVLKQFEKSEQGDIVVYFFEGLHGKHQFLTGFHQVMNRLKEKYYNRKGSNNIDLDWNLYDQVRIAYAVPRTISIITLNNGSNMNMFPTDLHGTASDSIYLSSLRIGGKANDQVERIKKLVISEVPSSWHAKAYSMGQNHVKELKHITNFPTMNVSSEYFSIPLPQEVISYKELEQVDAFDKGVHRVHLYEIKHECNIKEGHKLTHIHQYFAQWRDDHDMPIHEMQINE